MKKLFFIFLIIPLLAWCSIQQKDLFSHYKDCSQLHTNLLKEAVNKAPDWILDQVTVDVEYSPKTNYCIQLTSYWNSSIPWEISSSVYVYDLRNNKQIYSCEEMSWSWQQDIIPVWCSRSSWYNLYKEYGWYIYTDSINTWLKDR